MSSSTSNTKNTKNTQIKEILKTVTQQDGKSSSYIIELRESHGKEFDFVYNDGYKQDQVDHIIKIWNHRGKLPGFPIYHYQSS